VKNKNKTMWQHVDGGRAFIIPLTLLRHEKWACISAHCHKLIFDFGRQYSGFNNGYLLACWEHMRERGWRSKETLALAVAEAEHHKLIERTRTGGRNRPNRYALTWWPIDHRDDDVLDTAKTIPRAPSNAWKEATAAFEIPKKIRERRARNAGPKLTPPMVTIYRSPLSGQPHERKAA
jgi:hypothetical protein